MYYMKVIMELIKRFQFKVHHWPTCTFAWFVATFTISYVIAVRVGHVYPIIPFISDTGTLPPESCVFGQMLNIGSIMMGVTMYIRHRQVAFIIVKTVEDENRKKLWNNRSLIFGTIACLGLSIVANFQELNAMEIHLTGAGMAFGIGSIYFVIQAKISYILLRCDTNIVPINKNVVYLRIFLSVTIIPLFMFLCVCSLEVAERIKGDIKNIEWWTGKYFGYEYRIAGNFAEWIIATFMIVFILSFTKEFKSIKYEGIQLTYVTVNKSAVKEDKKKSSSTSVAVFVH